MGKSDLGDTTGRDHSSKPIHPQILVLAMQASDQAVLLATTMEAYVALEKLLASEQDALERRTIRMGLHSLMRTLNVETARQIGILIDQTNSICEFITKQSRSCAA